MTSSPLVEGGVVLDVHATAAIGPFERRRQTVHAVSSFDDAFSAQGGDAAGFVDGRAAFGTVHFDFLPEEFAVLFDLLGQLDLGVGEAASVFVEGGAGEGGFGGHGFGGGGDCGYLTHGAKLFIVG